MRVALYPRVSSQEQVDNYSIGEQIDRMKSYCQAKDWTIYKIYTDPGYSGSNMDRPGLQELISDAKKQRFDLVLVYRLDRLSRSQSDVLTLIEKVFQPNGIGFVSMSENFDTSTSTGRAMVGFLSVFAQLELEKIRERMMEGKDGRAKDGLFPGGTVPFGYTYNQITELLEVNEYEAMQVREVFSLYLQGKGYVKIGDILEKKGYLHKSGHWYVNTVRYTLTNPIYAGWIKHNDKLYPGKHEALVSKEDFDRVQEKLAIQTESHKRDRFYSTYLTGLIWCAHCGSKYTTRLGRFRKDGTRNIYYCCYSRCKKVKAMIKDPNCVNETYRMDKLDGIIFDEIRKLAIDPDYIQKTRADQVSEEPNKVAIIQAEIDKVDKQISKFMDLYALGTIDIDMISDKIKPLNDRKKALENELHAAQHVSHGMNDEEAVAIAASFGEVLDRGDFDEIRGVIEQLIHKIVIDNDDVTIHWNFN